jgi:hypothetical protein
LFLFNSKTRELVTDDDSVVTTCSTWCRVDNDKMATTSIDRQSYKQDICKSSYMSIDDTIKVSKALSREDYNSNASSLRGREWYCRGCYNPNNARSTPLGTW